MDATPINFNVCVCDGLCLEPVEVSADDSKVKRRNSVQKCISGAFSNLEFYSHNFAIVTVICWGYIFPPDYYGWSSLEDCNERLGEISQ